MDWEVVEWAMPIYELSMLVLPVIGFVLWYRRVRRDAIRRSRALGRYAVLVTAPVVFYILYILLIVGIEEVTHIPLATEMLARYFFPLVGLGLLITLIAILVFGVTLLFIRPRNMAAPDKDPVSHDAGL